MWADSVSDAPKSALSNNRAERSIKPFVIGRKNFLFANTPLGAQASGVIYSLIETAKGTGLDRSGPEPVETEQKPGPGGLCLDARPGASFQRRGLRAVAE